MTDLHYEHPKLVSIYDLGNGWSTDRDFYLSLAGEQPKRILDLGCGTGLLCNAYAERGHLVTGADPARNMLDAARGTPFGSKINWVQASAQTFQSDHTFDLIVMTGHAFQVLLEDEDVARACRTVARHLSPNGVWAFETRNPQIDWVSEWNGMQRELRSSEGVVRESFRVLSAADERIIFQTEYAFADERLVSLSELRFMSLEAITRHLNDSELRVDGLLGDWNGETYNPAQSREMILLVKRA